jgi:hypothetical protein
MRGTEMHLTTHHDDDLHIAKKQYLNKTMYTS